MGEDERQIGNVNRRICIFTGNENGPIMELRNEKSKIKKRCIACLLYVYFHRQVGDASEGKKS